MFENRKIIITLTTIPSRLKYILSTLLSLLKQSIKPDEVVVSLPLYSIRERSNKDPYIIDPILKNFIEKNNITVLRCNKDYGPATKLLGVLEREKKLNLSEDKESLIITVDDDKIYDIDTIKNLLEGWKRNKNCVVSRKGSILKRLSKNSKLYLSKKQLFDSINRINEIILLGNTIKKDENISVIFGTGGVLYRASYFNNDIFNYKKENNDFPEQKFFIVDDIFLSGYLKKNKITLKVIKFPENKFTIKLKNEGKKTTFLDPNTLNRQINPLKNLNMKYRYNSILCVEYFKDELLFP